MKNINVKFLLVLAPIIFLSSCTDYTWADYLRTPKSSYAAVSSGKNAFYTQEPNAFEILPYSIDPASKGFNETMILSHEEFPNSNAIFVIYSTWAISDVRLHNGWNTWRTQINLKYPQNLEFPISDSNTSKTVGRTTFYYERDFYTVNPSNCTSPPAYLHLVLDSINDFKPGISLFEIKSKAWKVVKIEDINGLDVTNSPGWKCYNDNIYTFRKNSTVRYEPGLDACDDDLELKNKGLENIFLDFTITAPDFFDFDNPGKIIMEIAAPPLASDLVEDYTMEIISSDFSSAVFRISNSSGQQADLHLVPDE